MGTRWNTHNFFFVTDFFFAFLLCFSAVFRSKALTHRERQNEKKTAQCIQARTLTRTHATLTHIECVCLSAVAADHVKNVGLVG